VKLCEGARRCDQYQLHQSQKDVKWHFNPFLSSSSGGKWEILVKSVKKNLHSLAGERSLDDEFIHSLLIEFVSILNNRPLAPLIKHPQDFFVLTPALILTGTLVFSLPTDVVIDDKRKRVYSSAPAPSEMAATLQESSNW